MLLVPWLPLLDGPKTFCANSRPRPAARAMARMMPGFRLNTRAGVRAGAAAGRRGARRGRMRECRGLQAYTPATGRYLAAVCGPLPKFRLQLDNQYTGQVPIIADLSSISVLP